MQNLYDATISMLLHEHQTLLLMYVTLEIGGTGTDEMTGNGRGIEDVGGIFEADGAAGGMIEVETVISIASVIVKGSKNVIGIGNREVHMTDLESGLGKETM